MVDARWMALQDLRCKVEFEADVDFRKEGVRVFPRH